MSVSGSASGHRWIDRLITDRISPTRGREAMNFGFSVEFLRDMGVLMSIELVVWRVVTAQK
jgi:hypothetical protein